MEPVLFSVRDKALLSTMFTEGRTFLVAALEEPCDFTEDPKDLTEDPSPDPAVLISWWEITHDSGKVDWLGFQSRCLRTRCYQPSESRTAHCSCSQSTPRLWKIPGCMTISSPAPRYWTFTSFVFSRYQLKCHLRENWHPAYVGLHGLEYNHQLPPISSTHSTSSPPAKPTGIYLYRLPTRHFAQRWTNSSEQTSRNSLPYGASILVRNKSIIQLNTQVNVIYQQAHTESIV